MGETGWDVLHVLYGRRQMAHPLQISAQGIAGPTARERSHALPRLPDYPGERAAAPLHGLPPHAAHAYGADPAQGLPGVNLGTDRPAMHGTYGITPTGSHPLDCDTRPYDERPERKRARIGRKVNAPIRGKSQRGTTDRGARAVSSARIAAGAHSARLIKSGPDRGYTAPAPAQAFPATDRPERSGEQARQPRQRPSGATRRARKRSRARK